MSFSIASSDARLRPEKWSFFAIPASNRFGVEVLFGVAAGAIGCGALPGTTPGADRIGNVVRGLLPGPPGELVGVTATWGA